MEARSFSYGMVYMCIQPHRMQVSGLTTTTFLITSSVYQRIYTINLKKGSVPSTAPISLTFDMGTSRQGINNIKDGN